MERRTSKDNEHINKHILSGKKQKKHLGQNFLVDKNIIELFQKQFQEQLHQYYRDYTNTDPSAPVWEIGAGFGALSQGLVPKEGRVYLFDIDPECCEYLQEHFKKEIEAKTLFVISDDVVQVWNKLMAKSAPVAIIGNLPFNIASKIIHKALIEEKPIAYLLFIIQKEVAERYTTEQRGKNSTPDAILAQARYDIRICRTIKRQAFYPQPHIEASIIEFKKKAQKKNQGEHTDTLPIKVMHELLEILFCHRRKQIQRSITLSIAQSQRKNSAKHHISLIPEACKRVGIAVDKRPEEIRIQQWIALAGCYHELIQASKR